MSKIDININKRVDKFHVTPGILAAVVILLMVTVVVVDVLVLLEVIR